MTWLLVILLPCMLAAGPMAYILARPSAPKADPYIIAKLERELLDGGSPQRPAVTTYASVMKDVYTGSRVPDFEHPYGTDRDGLITESRVALEKRLRENDFTFPSLADRMVQAENEARLRWPSYFQDEARADPLIVALEASPYSDAERADYLSSEPFPAEPATIPQDNPNTGEH